MDEKQKLQSFKEACENALKLYPCPPLARNYKQGLVDLIGMAKMYIDELEAEEANEE